MKFFKILVLMVFISVCSSWVIYRKNHKKKLICREETDWTNGTESQLSNAADRSSSSSEESSSESSDRRRSRNRQRRDIDIDPVHKEPIIFIGARSNNSVFIDDGDFDIVSDILTDEELTTVKQQIMKTCNALNSN